MFGSVRVFGCACVWVCACVLVRIGIDECVQVSLSGCVPVCERECECECECVHGCLRL